MMEKTKMCPWLKTECFRGAQCNFAHFESELRPRPEIPESYFDSYVKANKLRRRALKREGMERAASWSAGSTSSSPKLGEGLPGPICGTGEARCFLFSHLQHRGRVHKFISDMVMKELKGAAPDAYEE
ncbi:unnamed protein product [Vitrella brassicaformis CCMP3155]|uniref:C3H1-type domain-containing protein n=1 Tax=Vitrella brassicaformis (strain CCMP3155) TaxID=1169540 RepID=A0A0G4FSX8_VITBC|nr:unnamed protein product [Vitrella brassicaformis CCMP3155]|eukprot:CEM17587.1 unnamed protein product [Vitrella brassicaformis CCMP3155]